MDRKVEKILCRIGGIWNIITGLITVLFYGTWIKGNIFQNMDASTKGLNYLSENLHMVTVTFGLAFVLAGVINIFLTFKMNDDSILKIIPLWLFIWSMFSFFTVDIVGVVLYLSASFLMLSKNKMIIRFRKG